MCVCVQTPSIVVQKCAVQKCALPKDCTHSSSTCERSCSLLVCTIFLRSSYMYDLLALYRYLYSFTLSSFPPLFFHCFEDSNNNSCTRFSFRNTSNCNATIKSVVTLAEFDLAIVLPFRLALAARFCSVHQDVMSWGTLCQLVIGNWYRVQYFSHNTTRRHKLEKQHSGSVLAQRAKCSSWQTVVLDKH